MKGSNTFFKKNITEYGDRNRIKREEDIYIAQFRVLLKKFLLRGKKADHS